jgi:hypothetical protein
MKGIDGMTTTVQGHDDLSRQSSPTFFRIASSPLLVASRTPRLHRRPAIADASKAEHFRDNDHDDVHLSYLQKDTNFSTLSFGGMVVCNLQGHILEIDHHLLEPFGYEKEQELKGKSIDILLPDYDVHRVNSLLLWKKKEKEKKRQQQQDGQIKKEEDHDILIATTECTAQSREQLYCNVEVITRAYGIYLLLLIRPIYKFDRTDRQVPRELCLRCTAFGLIQNVASYGCDDDATPTTTTTHGEDYAITFLGLDSQTLLDTSLMGYVHEEDVRQLCRYLSYAAQRNRAVSLKICLRNMKTDQFSPYTIRVFWEAGEVICMITDHPGVIDSQESIPEISNNHPPNKEDVISSSEQLHHHPRELELIQPPSSPSSSSSLSSSTLTTDEQPSERTWNLLKIRRTSAPGIRSWKSYFGLLQTRRTTLVQQSDQTTMTMTPQVEEIDLSSHETRSSSYYHLATNVSEKMFHLYTVLITSLSRWFNSHLTFIRSISSSPP